MKEDKQELTENINTQFNGVRDAINETYDKLKAQFQKTAKQRADLETTLQRYTKMAFDLSEDCSKLKQTTKWNDTQIQALMAADEIQTALDQ